MTGARCAVSCYGERGTAERAPFTIPFPQDVRRSVKVKVWVPLASIPKRLYPYSIDGEFRVAPLSHACQRDKGRRT